MCQLTLINNPKLLIPLLYENSLDNKDGVGIYSYDTKQVFKSEKQAVEVLTDVYKFLKENKSKIYLAHVRSASTNKTNIKAEFSHPFITDNYIVFHNGTFEGFNVNTETTDTLEFAKELSKNYSENIIEAFNKTYKTGKFALMIVDRNTDKIYVLRGETADLNFFRIKMGDENIVLINTLSSDVYHVIDIVNITKSLFTSDKSFIRIEETFQLEKNTAYEFINNQLVKIGEVKEAKKQPVTVYGSRYNFSESYDYNYAETYNINNLEFINKLKNMGLSLFEVDFLLKSLFNKNIYNVYNNNIYESLYNKISPYFDNRKKYIWNKIQNKSDMFVLDIYRKFNLKVPYFVNSIGDLEKCLKSI